MNNVVSISEEIAVANGLTLEEALILLVASKKININQTADPLITKGLIDYHYDEQGLPCGYRLSVQGGELLSSLVLDSEKTQQPIDRLSNLASGLKQIFPAGKKAGTNYYWSDGIALISKRLKLFFKKYGNDYSDEQILDAAKRYVESFNGTYTYMKLLKYFILKEKIGVGGDQESESELVNYIENAGQESTLGEDWTTELR